LDSDLQNLFVRIEVLTIPLIFNVTESIGDVGTFIVLAQITNVVSRGFDLRVANCLFKVLAVSFQNFCARDDCPIRIALVCRQFPSLASHRIRTLLSAQLPACVLLAVCNSDVTVQL
jgi:hypothetical protein